MHRQFTTFVEAWADSAAEAAGGAGEAVAAPPPYEAVASIWQARLGDLRLVLLDGDDGPVVQTCGDALPLLMPGLERGQPLFDLYPVTVRSIQADLLAPVFAGLAGIYKVARYWCGERQRAFEWLLLPVVGEAGAVVALGGVCPAGATPNEASHSPDRALLAAQRTSGSGPVLSERMQSLDYMTPGRPAAGFVPDFKPLTASFLAASRARVTSGGEAIALRRGGIGGLAAVEARDAARASILFIGDAREHVSLLGALSKRYRLRIITSVSEAEQEIHTDRADVIVISEVVPRADGLRLIDMGQTHNPHFCGGVLIAEQQGETLDEVLEGRTRPVHCLVKPVGEFALRRVIDAVTRERP